MSPRSRHISVQVSGEITSYGCSTVVLRLFDRGARRRKTRGNKYIYCPLGKSGKFGLASWIQTNTPPPSKPEVLLLGTVGVLPSRIGGLVRQPNHPGAALKQACSTCSTDAASQCGEDLSPQKSCPCLTNNSTNALETKWVGHKRVANRHGVWML